MGEGCDPLLRRPFSAYYVEDDRVEIIFNIVGKGTAVLAQTPRGAMLDVLGPLGVPYHLEEESFDTGVLIAGGLGIAPMPLATRALRSGGKKILTLLGGRSSEQVLTEHLENVHVATDDGSRGFHGTVVDLAEKLLAEMSPARPKLFACGPTAMLRAVAALALRLNLPCEVSLEGAMACGIGICQGCPVELVGCRKEIRIDVQGRTDVRCPVDPAVTALSGVPVYHEVGLQVVKCDHAGCSEPGARRYSQSQHPGDVLTLPTSRERVCKRFIINPCLWQTHNSASPV